MRKNIKEKKLNNVYLVEMYEYGGGLSLRESILVRVMVLRFK